MKVSTAMIEDLELTVNFTALCVSLQQQLFGLGPGVCAQLHKYTRTRPAFPPLWYGVAIQNSGGESNIHNELSGNKAALTFILNPKSHG